MNTSKSKFTISIKNEALRLGFDLVGITTPEPPAHIEVYQEWINSGKHGEMAYLGSERALQRRSNPLEILPDCQSILVVGMNYFPGASKSRATTLKVSNYAMGLDYHDLITQRLKELMNFISKIFGRSISHRTYVDTGPLLERELAQRAGLGWIGKNSCLIHPKLGSYMFLGEILLGLELEMDPPFDIDRCGSCTRCIEACPTGCILPNRTMDARQCISYLTIEHKGSIPHALRPKIGSWVFGCDICQQVCPWNHRFARETREPSYQPIPFLSQASLQEFLSLNQDSFREQLRGSPLKRPKWHGILRNAALVAGNNKEPHHIPELTRLLLDNPDPIVRSHAAWALGCIGGKEVAEFLAKAIQGEVDPGVADEIVKAQNFIEKE